MEIYFKPWTNFANFEGRASRKEYWTFVLINIAINIAFSIMAKQVSIIGLAGGLFSLAIIIPSLAVAVRRLHDTGKSGWAILVGIIPVIGWLIALVFMLQESSGDNEYGITPVE
ncbi:MAG: DUF805 domain-containing protein [Candidatus Rifleibacteriota bacterium]